MIYTHTAVGIYGCPWFSRLTVSFLICPCVENMGPKILITSKCREFIGAILIVIKVCIYVFILLKNEISDIHIFWKENCRTFVWKPVVIVLYWFFFYREGPFCFAFKFVCLGQHVKSVKSKNNFKMQISSPGLNNLVGICHMKLLEHFFQHPIHFLLK